MPSSIDFKIKKGSFTILSAPNVIFVNVKSKLVQRILYNVSFLVLFDSKMRNFNNMWWTPKVDLFFGEILLPLGKESPKLK